MKKWTIGIDEVGRGALAGPVVVCAALLKGVIPAEAGVRISKSGKLRDSKKLSGRQREKWFSYFKSCPTIDFAVARIYPRRIEKMNISRAANLAAGRACERLIAGHGLTSCDVHIFLDGGLFLGNAAQPKNARTVVKGDEKFPAVAIASIIAKVSRDRFMVRLAKKYPEYGLDAHKGYGTKRHYEALERYGSRDIHRKTFLRDKQI